MENVERAERALMLRDFGSFRLVLLIDCSSWSVTVVLFMRLVD